LDEGFADAVHGIHKEAEGGFLESWEMHEGAHPIEVGLKNGEIEEERGGIWRGSGAGRCGADAGFELGGEFGISGSAVGCFELEAIPFGRVVTSGDHDAAVELMMAGGEGDDGGWQGFASEGDGDAVSDEDISGEAGESITLEAVVVADDDAARVRGAGEEVISDRLRDDAEVVKSEGVGDNTAPAVGTEFDGGRRSHEYQVISEITK